jgi:hypothetical protein
MKKLLLAIVFLAAPGLALADAGDSRVIELWSCALKDGKTMEQVAAHNSKWLAFVRKAVAEGDVNSYGLQSIVGENTSFMFVDSYPDLQAWGAVKGALESDEGKALEAGFAELSECTKNRLYKSTQH